MVTSGSLADHGKIYGNQWHPLTYILPLKTLLLCVSHVLPVGPGGFFRMCPTELQYQTLSSLLRRLSFHSSEKPPPPPPNMIKETWISGSAFNHLMCPDYDS